VNPSRRHRRGTEAARLEEHARRLRELPFFAAPFSAQRQMAVAVPIMNLLMTTVVVKTDASRLSAESSFAWAVVAARIAPVMKGRQY